MQETEIAHYLEEALGIPDLQIQLVWQEKDLLIILNRSGEAPLEYAAVTKQVISELKVLRVPPPNAITFYSRVMGAYDPDWQTTVRISKRTTPQSANPETVPENASPAATVILSSTHQSPTLLESPTSSLTAPLHEDAETKLVSAYPGSGMVEEAPALEDPAPPVEELSETMIISVVTPPIVESPPTPPAAAARSLSDFCFARNKHLVKTSLPNPDKAIAEIIFFFNSLDESTQLDLAPVLEDFFQSPDKTSLVGVSPEIRSWIEGFKKLGDREFKSASVWLSRYCLDPAKAMEQVNAVFDALAEIASVKAKEEAAAQTVLSPVPESVSKTYSSKSSGTSPKTARQTSAKTVTNGSQQFSVNELPLLLGATLLIGGIGWFLWGTANVLGPFGWVAALAGMVSGMATMAGNKGLKSAAGVVLIVIYVIFFGLGFIVLLIEGLGWLIGIIAAGAVSSIINSSGAQRITDPKPLRVILAILAVLLVTMGNALLTAKPSQSVSNASIIEITISDTEMLISTDTAPKKAELLLFNETSQSCQFKIDIVSSGSVLLTGNTLIPPENSATIGAELGPGKYRVMCEGKAQVSSLSLKGPEFSVLP